MDSSYKIYVCLTTIPSRIDEIDKTIDSLMNQTILPTKIFISIPKKYTFRFDGISIDEDRIIMLKEKYNILDIILLDNDYGPGSKLLGPLLNRDLSIDSFLLVVDDDLIYDRDMIKLYIMTMSINESNNYTIYNFYGYYLNDIKIVQQSASVLIPIKLLSQFLKYFEKISDNKDILYHDDGYLSYYFHKMKIDVKTIDICNTRYGYNNIFPVLHSRTDVDALFKIKGKLSRKMLNYNIIKWLSAYNFDEIFRV
jgi:hypothetical protein